MVVADENKTGNITHTGWEDRQKWREEKRGEEREREEESIFTLSQSTSLKPRFPSGQAV